MTRTIQAQGLRSFTIVVRITATVAWRNAGPLFCFAVGGHGISPKVAFVSIESASMAPCCRRGRRP